jgi:hypothetical protein
LIPDQQRARIGDDRGDLERQAQDAKGAKDTKDAKDVDKVSER